MSHHVVWARVVMIDMCRDVATHVRWFGHVVRAKRTLANTILQGKGEMKRARGKPVYGRCKMCQASWVNGLNSLRRSRFNIVWSFDGCTGK